MWTNSLLLYTTIVFDLHDNIIISLSLRNNKHFNTKIARMQKECKKKLTSLFVHSSSFFKLFSNLSNAAKSSTGSPNDLSFVNSTVFGLFDDSEHVIFFIFTSNLMICSSSFKMWLCKNSIFLIDVWSSSYNMHSWISSFWFPFGLEVTRGISSVSLLSDKTSSDSFKIWTKFGETDVWSFLFANSWKNWS